MSREPLPPIKWAELADALQRTALSLLEEWLPHGKYNPQNKEYTCGSVAGDSGSSLSVNVETGLWKDFSTGESGRDLLDLYAAIHDLSKGKAAVQVAREYGLESVAGLVMAPAGGVAPVPKPPRPAPEPKPQKESEKWETIKPAPLHHLQPTFIHPAKERSKDCIDHTARYQVGDDLYGFVVRFIDSSGDKVTIPYTYARSLRDGTETWKWRFWADPRPLYFPGGRLPDGRTVVLVEGERKAECLQILLDVIAPDVYCVVSWPGGSNAWQKAMWEWLAGHTVIMWPDCDSLREKPPRDELKACNTDEERDALKQRQPYLEFDAQPGMKAMLGIGALLRDTHGCTVQLLPIDKPGLKPSGWDCRDAIETDGWDGERVLAYFGTARAVLADVSAPAAVGGGGGGKKIDSPVGTGGAGGGGSDDDGDEFSAHLAFIAEQLKIKVFELQPNRKMIVAALRKAPDLQGCLGYDKLRDGPATRKAWPWRDVAGQVEDQDDLRLGDYLEQTYKIKSPSRAALAEAIETVADENPFHPVQDWLKSLKWDNTPRLEKWLIHVLGHDPAVLATKPRFKRYLELVGRYILLGQVARAIEPGVKFDYSVVLEGLTGKGKSTLVQALVGKDYFSDTHFDIGAGKDGMEQLAGLWGYELSEMTAFRRADSEAVKQFFSTTTDRYRGAYGKYVKPHPRQVVIWCTTNKKKYLYDLTGNRRFWPVWVERRLRIEWVKKWRGQLFAEAMALYLQGAQIFPSEEDEQRYFLPEQEKRVVETGIQSRLYDLLTRQGAPSAEAKGAAYINQHTTFVTVAELVVALGTDPGKSSAPLETQVRDWLVKYGWEDKREGGGQRRRGYKAPDVWPPVVPPDEDDEDNAPSGAPVPGPGPGPAPSDGDGEWPGAAAFPGGGDYDPI